MRDLERELEELDEGWPPSWQPEVGEHLLGRVRRYAKGPTAYGEVRTLVVDRDDGEGAVSVWLSSHVLLALFEREKPRVGERIGISYQGKHPTKGYHRYALVVDRPSRRSTSVRWAASWVRSWMRSRLTTPTRSSPAHTPRHLRAGRSDGWRDPEPAGGRRFPYLRSASGRQLRFPTQLFRAGRPRSPRLAAILHNPFRRR
jgi:hypothetical protein